MHLPASSSHSYAYPVRVSATPEQGTCGPLATDSNFASRMLFADIHIPDAMMLHEQPGSTGIGGTPICFSDGAGHCFNSGETPYCECTTGKWSNSAVAVPVQQALAVPLPLVDGSMMKDRCSRVFDEEYCLLLAGCKPQVLNDDNLRELAGPAPSLITDASLRAQLAAEPLDAPPQAVVQVRPSVGHAIMAGHACALAGLQALTKGDASTLRQDAIANAAAVTPLGALALRDALAPP